jgi:uncharacterized protein YdeI (YjbR/CyaY-like superfamily)
VGATSKTASARQTFTALLERDGTRLNWVIARVPFDPAEVWPERKGMRVRGEFEGFALRTSLFSGPPKGHCLLVSKQMLVATEKAIGSSVRIWLEPDFEDRVAEIPPEMAEALKADRKLRKWFDELSYSMRKEIAGWVSEPKTEAARRTRAERMAERLLLTMEGEKEPPPILRLAFQRQPDARRGWEAMTQVQRRRHLLGIHYYQTPEARERRAAKVVEEALRVARRAAASKAK